jgi:putative glycosyltransferase (TIGR04372 family)
MSAIGHDVSDFIEFIYQHDSQRPSDRIRLLFRYNSQSPTNNLFLFEVWKRRLIHTNNVTIHGTSAFMWSIILYTIGINKIFYQLPNYWLIPLTPNFSTFRSFERRQIASLMDDCDRQEIEDLLNQTIKTPPGTYCVLGIRDSGFYHDHSIRNSTIDDYLPSIEMLLDLGIPVVRMGRRMQKPLPISHPLCFDYAFSDLINDKNDVLLWANARFAFGDASGLTGVVASFGSPLFMPTYSLSPREFISNQNVSFATQSLIKKDGNALNIGQIISLMNKGFSLGDERVLDALNLFSLRNSPMQIRESLEWFLATVINETNANIDYARSKQHNLLSYLEGNDKDNFTHYRKDILYSKTWTSMKSIMWPKSVDALFSGMATEYLDE